MFYCMAYTCMCGEDPGEEAGKNKHWRVVCLGGTTAPGNKVKNLLIWDGDKTRRMDGQLWHSRTPIRSSICNPVTVHLTVGLCNRPRHFLLHTRGFTNTTSSISHYAAGKNGFCVQLMIRRILIMSQRPYQRLCPVFFTHNIRLKCEDRSKQVPHSS